MASLKVRFSSHSTYFTSMPRLNRPVEEKFLRTARTGFSNAEKSMKTANIMAVTLYQSAKKSAKKIAATTSAISTEIPATLGVPRQASPI